MGDLLQLTRELIEMRKHPLKNDGVKRYPAAAVQFAEAVRLCDDAPTLREVIRLDTGHVLPTASKQQVYQKLLADPAQRTADLLERYAMHLEMFGYIDNNGQRVPDAGPRIEPLLTEAATRPDCPTRDC